MATPSNTMAKAKVGRRPAMSAPMESSSSDATIQSRAGWNTKYAATIPQENAIANRRIGCFPPQKGERISRLGPGEFTALQLVQILPPNPGLPREQFVLRHAGRGE